MGLQLDLSRLDRIGRNATKAAHEAKREAQRPLIERVAAAHALYLQLTTPVNWQEDQEAVADVETAKDEIANAVEGLGAEDAERVLGIGKCRGRTSVANAIQAEAEKTTAGNREKRDKLDLLFSRVLEDAVEAKNLLVLPHPLLDKNGNPTETIVTLDSLKAKMVDAPGKVEGETVQKSREVEVVFGRGKFRTEGEDGHMHAVALHAPSFQNSKMVQALVLSLRGAGSKLSKLAREAYDHYASTNGGNGQSNGGEQRTGYETKRGDSSPRNVAGSPDHENRSHRRNDRRGSRRERTGEREARGLPSATDEADGQ